jgi:hypothetical protein
LTGEENRDCVQLERVHAVIKLFELETHSLPPTLEALLQTERGPYLLKRDLLTPSGQPIVYIVAPTRDSFRLIGALTVLESPSPGHACELKHDG